ncbi:hypothetical protein RDABS01_007259 [Bienertia sinuspersici]
MLLDTNFSGEEIKQAMWEIDNAKALGYDWYNSNFTKETWEAVGADVISAIHDFVTSGKLLERIKITVVTLIPKGINPVLVLHKCIAKLLYSRLKRVLPDLIAPNQGAFVASKSILHNILVSQDIVKHYERKNYVKGCLIKMDLRKAYDTIEWSFVEQMMVELEFPVKFNAMVMTCLNSIDST